jgi:nitrous oxidase accessory protein NosD/PKD repeat protein
MDGLKGLSLLLLVSLGVMLMVVAGAEGAEGATITVPDDQPTIQDAIDNAADWDTVFIKEGMYRESVVVWKPLTIRGESQEGTVISMNDPYVMLIVSSKAIVTTLTIQDSVNNAGLILQGSYCMVEDVTIRDNLWGLWVNRGYHNVIDDVYCINNSWQGVLVEEADGTRLLGVTSKENDVGIMVRAAIGTTISDCNIEDNKGSGLVTQQLSGSYETTDVKVMGTTISGSGGNGAEFADTDHITVRDCTIEDSAWSAIRADRCDDVTIKGCTVLNFARLGIAFQGPDSRGCLIEDNTILDEGTAWSKIIVHMAEDCVIRGNYINALSSAISVLMANNTLVEDNEMLSTNDNASFETVGIIVGRHRAGVLLPPTNVTLMGNEVRNFTEGIRVRGGWDIDIIDCTVEEAEVGIAFSVFDWGDDPIVGGVVRGCILAGCGMVIEGMLAVTVEDNTIKGAEVGMFFNATSNAVKDNLFRANTIMDCSRFGLAFNVTNGTNRFHLNTFMNNTEHTNQPMETDLFDDGAMYGNYWDDYEERYPNANVTGRVWDTPYAVGAFGVMDDYPLAYAYDTKDPVADAGEEQGGEVGNAYLFSGTGSSDNGVIVRYTWTFTYADTPVELEGETVTFPFLLIGSYLVTLEVEDAWGNTDVNWTSIHIEDLNDPVANAGEDIEMFMGGSFLLNGSASTDDGIIVTWEWTLDPEGLDRVMEGELVWFIIDEPGDYSAVLRVFDEAGNWDFDDVVIHVLDVVDPVADAGRDFTVDQGDIVTLYGGWSRDNVGVKSWTWTFTEEGQVVIEVGMSVDREFSMAGAYTVYLNVSDEAGNWDVDELTLTVRDTEPPLADASTDVTVDQGTLVTLDGSASTDNMDIVFFNWVFAEGSLLKNLQGAAPSYQFNIPGEYELELQVFDAAGNVGLDWVIVIVEEVPTIRQWRLGPFEEGKGALGGVRLVVTLNGNSYVAYTGDDGYASFIVEIADLVSPASVMAEKEGWDTLDLTIELDSDGDPVGSIPLMKRAKVDGGGEGDDEIDWLAWGLVIVLMIAYAGTLLYLSKAAKRAGEE